MTLGFTQEFWHTFSPVWANDFDEEAVATYNRNYGAHCKLGDIVDLCAADYGVPEVRGERSSSGVALPIPV
jgi:site-specific DNA-cytosine methylase